ncbi:MAG: TIGR03013 family PEP-CTERM/XrtA system glycosyltransferase [Methyloprofundus sp.]|nr:TIGR03013 family PEP-CTERM/XrtA system glycosyltransferase [Methyloprofundus sp.]
MIRIFKHYISSAYLGLIVCEWVIFFLAMYLGSDVRFIEVSSWYTHQDIIEASFIFSAVLSLSSIGIGLYRRSLDWDDYHLALRVCVSFAIGSVIIISIYYLFPRYSVARSVFVYAIGFAFIGIMLSRYFFYHYANTDNLMRRVLVLGTGKKAKQLCNINHTYILKGFIIHGFVDMGEGGCLIDKERLIENTQGLTHLVIKHNIDEIVIALDDRRLTMPLEELLDCKVLGAKVMDLLSFYEREQGLILLDSLTLSWVVFSDGFDFSGLKSVIKRGVDLVASLVLFLVAWPFMLLTALAILLESGLKQPILYKQIRVGENGKLFSVMKFRSMRTDAEKNGVQWAELNDDRVTRVGRFIRKCRIDELPQIFNVLKGDMSFVGPRPERPEYVGGFQKRIPFYAERHRVKPGITGWAQLCYPYGAGEQDTINKLEYDLYYVKNHSLFLDVSIIIGTVEVILWGRGAR